jgi:hypothetical protein
MRNVPSARAVVAQELLGSAASHAMKLAAATGRGVWVNTLLRVYHARAEILPVEHIDALYAFLRRTRGVDWELLGDYVVLLRTLSSRMTPAEGFSSRRVEGLLGLGYAGYPRARQRGSERDPTARIMPPSSPRAGAAPDPSRQPARDVVWPRDEPNGHGYEPFRHLSRPRGRR